MELKLVKINYKDISPKQQESYNFQKVSAVFADYGFTTIRLTDDWQGADFLARHADGKTILKVQLKGRATIERRYIGKELWICFPSGSEWYLYPHDDVVQKVLERTEVASTKSWQEEGGYSFPHVTRELAEILSGFRLKEEKCQQA